MLKVTDFGLVRAKAAGGIAPAETDGDSSPIGSSRNVLAGIPPKGLTARNLLKKHAGSHVGSRLVFLWLSRPGGREAHENGLVGRGKQQWHLACGRSRSFLLGRCPDDLFQGVGDVEDRIETRDLDGSEYTGSDAD